MGAVSLSMDGLLEGHESSFYRSMYRLMMFCFVTFSLVGGMLPFVAIGGPAGLGMMVPLLGVVIYLMLIITLTLTRWYRTSGLEPKVKHLCFALIATTFLLDIVGVCAYTKAMVAPEVTPMPTMCPTLPQKCKADVDCFNNMPRCANPFQQPACTDPLPYCPTPVPSGIVTPAPRSPWGPYPPAGPTFTGKNFVTPSPAPAPITEPPITNPPIPTPEPV